MHKRKPATNFAAHVDAPRSPRPVVELPRRSKKDLEAAERLLHKLGGKLCGGGRIGPSRHALLRAAVFRETGKPAPEAALEGTAARIAPLLSHRNGRT
jgi:hypothetical protein